MHPVRSLRAPALVMSLVVAASNGVGSGTALGQQPATAALPPAPAGTPPTSSLDPLALPAPMSDINCCDPYTLSSPSCGDACYADSCYTDACCNRTWFDGGFGFVRLGSGKIDAPLESDDGLNWAIGAVMPIHNSRVAPIVAFDALHDASTQSLASAGFTIFPDVWSCSHLDRIGLTLLVQNYDDSVFRGADLWRSNVDISYVLTPTLLVGFYAYDRIDDAEVDFSPVPGFAAVFTTRMSDVRGGYVSHTIGPVNWSLRAGYGNRPDAWRVGGSLDVAVADDLSVYLSADRHEEDQWGAIAGLQYYIFPGRNCCR